MQPIIPMAPQGRQTMTLAVVANNAAVDACPRGTTANKWKILRAIEVAAPALGVPHGRVALLDALLSFHPEDELVTGQNLTVWPSNRALARRAHVSHPTVTRGLGDLVKAGLIIRRDSPNCKRYAKKGQGGTIAQAFGFDLTLLVVRAGEIQQLAAEVEQQELELKHLRLSISVNRREIRKMLETATLEQLPGDWPSFEANFLPLSRRISRSISYQDAAVLADALCGLAGEIRKVMITHVESNKLMSSDHQNEQHIQNSTTHPKIDSEPGLPIGQGQPQQPSTQTPRPPQRSYPLGMILDACPDIADYARLGISSWRDLVATADDVRPLLGISPSAWDDAKSVLGPEDAATLLAAILQRSAAINSPGGYLRHLTEKARAGAFSLGPVLMALISTNQNRRQGKRA